MRFTTIIQARLGSSRFPKKIIKPILGETLLFRQMERLKASILNDLPKIHNEFIIATTTNPEDEVIVSLCQNHGWQCFRGHPTDLLGRHYHAALEYGADWVLKIPSDCPLICPEVIDQVVLFAIDHLEDYDYISNLHPATFPDGNDVEIFSMPCLQQAFVNANKDFEREHTTPFFWEQPQKYRIGNVTFKGGANLSMTHRWTIDYPEDYTFINAIYEGLYAQNPLFGLEDILNFCRENPRIFELNQAYAGVNWYRNHINDLKSIDSTQTRQLP